MSLHNDPAASRDLLERNAAGFEPLINELLYLDVPVNEAVHLKIVIVLTEWVDQSLSN